MTKTAIKERPILFSGEMVQAILDGRKTQTRRVIKPQPEYKDVNGIFASWVFKGGLLYPNAKAAVLGICPYGKPGDRLWVRESFYYDLSEPGQEVLYRDPGGLWEFRSPEDLKGVPSIHMPRWASRITLEITDVWVERVQDISDEDAREEGFRLPGNQCDYIGVYRDRFPSLWDSINAGKGLGWDANPWVWVIEFRRVEG